MAAASCRCSRSRTDYWYFYPRTAFIRGGPHTAGTLILGLVVGNPIPDAAVGTLNPDPAACTLIPEQLLSDVVPTSLVDGSLVSRRA